MVFWKPQMDSYTPNHEAKAARGPWNLNPEQAKRIMCNNNIKKKKIAYENPHICCKVVCLNSSVQLTKKNKLLHTLSLPDFSHDFPAMALTRLDVENHGFYDQTGNPSTSGPRQSRSADAPWRHLRWLTRYHFDKLQKSQAREKKDSVAPQGKAKLYPLGGLGEDTSQRWWKFGIKMPKKLRHEQKIQTCPLMFGMGGAGEKNCWKQIRQVHWIYVLIPLLHISLTAGLSHKCMYVVGELLHPLVGRFVLSLY